MMTLNVVVNVDPYLAMPQEEFDKEMVKAYVPEADCLSWGEAVALAYKRSENRALNMEVAALAAREPV